MYEKFTTIIHRVEWEIQGMKLFNGFLVKFRGLQTPKVGSRVLTYAPDLLKVYVLNVYKV